EFLAELFATVLTDAIQGFVDFFTTIVDVLVGIFNFFKDMWTTSVDNVMEAWDRFQVALEIGKDFIQDNVFEPIQNGISAVGDFISGVLDDIESGWDSFIDFLGSIPDRISGAVSGMWDGIWDAFKGAINSIIDAWNNLSFSVPSVDMASSVGSRSLRRTHHGCRSVVCPWERASRTSTRTRPSSPWRTHARPTYWPQRWDERSWMRGPGPTASQLPVAQ